VIKDNRISGNTTGALIEWTRRQTIMGNEVADNDTGVVFEHLFDSTIAG
jgi:nitrous oxidase accessory protein NosD